MVKGETDETYTGDNYIVNYPNKGRFTFTKFMGDGKAPLTVTSDSQRAEFALYEGDQADPGKLVDTFRCAWTAPLSLPTWMRGPIP